MTETTPKPVAAPTTTLAAATAKPQADKKKQAAVAKAVAPRQIIYPFWFGGSASSMAACVTHPLDLGTLPPLPSPSPASSFTSCNFFIFFIFHVRGASTQLTPIF